MRLTLHHEHPWFDRSRQLAETRGLAGDSVLRDAFDRADTFCRRAAMF
jgi:hypothetical protein